MIVSTKSVIAIAFLSVATFGFIYWRVQSHAYVQMVTNSLIVDDVSGSVLNDPYSVRGLAGRALARRHLARGSTLTLITTGDGQTADEPRLVAKYEVPLSRRALEGKAGLERRKREIISDLEARLKNVPSTDRSPIFLAMRRAVEQLRASGCTTESDCALFVRTDGAELAEPQIKNAIESGIKGRRLPAPIPNGGIRVTICGLAETNTYGNADKRAGAGRAHSVQRDERVREVWSSLFTVSSLVSFEPYCSEAQANR